MRCRLSALGMTVLLMGSSLPAGPADPTAARADLDSFEPGRLERDLQDELDDIFEFYDPDEDVTPEVMFDEIMVALGDEGDYLDPEENEISLQDLRDEIEELGDGTTLEDVVMEALGVGQADAGGPASGALTTPFAVGPDTTPSWVWTETAEPRTVGVSRTGRALVTNVNAVKK